MEIIIGIVFLLIVGFIALVIQYWWVLLICFALAGIIALIIRSAYSCHLSKIVSAKIITEEPIVETESVSTGHSTGWGGKYPIYYEHYEDRDVVAGYKVTFFVVFENGNTNYITCRKNGSTYKKIIKKIN